MKKYIFLPIYLIISFDLFAGNFTVYEANYPNVKDYNVNIDEAILTIIPHGAYVEINLEMAISYDFESWFFKNYNELEFSWDFQLPDQVTMNDFWLWVGDTILQVEVLDRWTAELLFSEVSSPVRNPALFTQSFPNREGLVKYNIRVYPVERDIQRRFKIQYLIPARPTNETLRVWLPTSPLTSRKSPGVQELEVRFKGENEPVLLAADILTQSFQDSTWNYTIALGYDQFVELVYDSPIEDDFFFSTYEDQDETFYQLIVYPPHAENIYNPKNYLILIDYNRFNTKEVDGELVLLLLKETMVQALTEADSVNIIVAYNDIAFGANEFVSCSEQNLDSLFNNVLRRSFPSYSSFQLLFAAASGFLRNSNTATDIIMLTNTDEIGYIQNAEYYAEGIIDMFPTKTRLHMVDLDNKSNLAYNHITNQYETQMFSFYSYLAHKTEGNLYFLRYHSIKNILAALFYESISHFNEIEVQTRFASGYAYGQNLIALHQGYYPLQFPVMQVGRYRGELPLDITIVGKVRLEKIVETLTITEADVTPGNAKLATAWNGNHIHELLKQPQTTTTILDIMDISLQEKILTPYTGFLVFSLEQTDGFDPDDTPMNDGDPTRGEDVLTTVNDSESESDTTEQEITLSAYPNPFNLAVTIQINLPTNTEFELAIFNARGQKVRDFKNASTSGQTSVRWDGSSDNSSAVATGLYFAVISGQNFKKAVKLMLIK